MFHIHRIKPEDNTWCLRKLLRTHLQSQNYKCFIFPLIQKKWRKNTFQQSYSRYLKKITDIQEKVKWQKLLEDWEGEYISTQWDSLSNVVTVVPHEDRNTSKRKLGEQSMPPGNYSYMDWKWEEDEQNFYSLQNQAGKWNGKGPLVSWDIFHLIQFL